MISWHREIVLTTFTINLNSLLAYSIDLDRLAYRWLQNIYYAFVFPHLLYGFEIYANTYASYLDKLVKINSKILRILLNQPIRTPVSQLYETFGLLPITVCILRQQTSLPDQWSH